MERYDECQYDVNCASQALCSLEEDIRDVSEYIDNADLVMAQFLLGILPRPSIAEELGCADPQHLSQAYLDATRRTRRRIDEIRHQRASRRY